ncbi:MAG: methyltransferase domain-containing protein [Candidatus Aureabacteria bacterium]|nr:methyltransferase domain-containing protein [Candidatus Auribacterota bacterium]
MIKGIIKSFFYFFFLLFYRVIQLFNKEKITSIIIKSPSFHKGKKDGVKDTAVQSDRSSMIIGFLCDSLFYGKGSEKDRYSYQKEWIDFTIQPGEKVLDIGSGAYPFPLATHLADLYEGETTHRSEKLIKDHRPFYQYHIESMPFSDKEFDFVYCSHVLEHVSDPAKACNELMRIGKRGFIETPTKTSDILFNFPRLKNHHKWHIEILGNTLIFMEWKEKERKDLGTNYFLNQFHSLYRNPFQDMVIAHRDLFVNMFLWKDRFNYLVINNKGAILQSSLIPEK